MWPSFELVYTSLDGKACLNKISHENFYNNIFNLEQEPAAGATFGFGKPGADQYSGSPQHWH